MPAHADRMQHKTAEQWQPTFPGRSAYNSVYGIYGERFTISQP